MACADGMSGDDLAIEARNSKNFGTPRPTSTRRRVGTIGSGRCRRWARRSRPVLVRNQSAGYWSVTCTVSEEDATRTLFEPVWPLPQLSLGPHRQAGRERQRARRQQLPAAIAPR
jgi:hypothetical protein